MDKVEFVTLDVDSISHTISLTEQLITRLKRIPDGYVGPTSKKPTFRAIRKAKKILSTVESGRMPWPQVTPVPNGSVIMSWVSLTRDIMMVIDNSGDVQFTTSLKKIDIDTAEVIDHLDSEGFVTDMLTIDHMMVWYCADTAYLA